ncbi:MAG: putative peptidyl-prolyl cis-trans isomerase [Fibrobacteres bacterium]|nr:putative peptidyl-prolyl cis-trans isomerase [Fibrobacterota bacterium]
MAQGIVRFTDAAKPMIFTLCLSAFSAMTAWSAAAPADTSNKAVKGKDVQGPSAKPVAAPTSSTQGALAPGLYAEFYTPKGKITTQLEFEKTPLTVTNFVGLAEGTKSSNKPAGTRFYDGLTFHRVVPDFMIQGGDPQGNGTGGPGYQFADEFDSTLRHDKPGTLSMANAGPGTNGSQFFITHVPTPHLDGKHTVFGHVISGQDVVNAIVVGTPIDSVRIQRVGPKAKKFKADEAAFQTQMKKNADLAAGKNKKADAERKKMEAATNELIKKATATPSGLKYIVTRPGAGAKPAQGASVKVHYAGRLVDGKEFDNSYKRGQPIDFKVGTGMVIPGWDEGIMLMQKGEKRTLIIPPNLAYGPEGRPPVIPQNATLIFDVELVDFQ